MARTSIDRRAAGTGICLLSLIVTLGAAGFAEAQKEPEEKAPTLAEAKAAFAKADRALNQARSVAKAAIAEGRAPAELTQQQRDWLELRDYRGGYESEQAGEKNAKRSATWHRVAAELAESRAEWLRGRARTTAPEETLTGLWITLAKSAESFVESTDRLVQR